MTNFDWECPYCNRHATITDSSRSEGETIFNINNSVGNRILAWSFVVCPNEKCKKFTLAIALFNGYCSASSYQWTRGYETNKWQLIPQSNAKVFPEYIPEVIRDDYREACLICDLSPKASATLARRCLQGILRDFWKVKSGKLAHEIDQIKDKVDVLTWEAIEGVRKIGNIGAHMEKDIDTIVDVEPNEAKLLIELIETLFKDWYMTREERKNRLSKIKEVFLQKEEIKNAKQKVQ